MAYSDSWEILTFKSEYDKFFMGETAGAPLDAFRISIAVKSI